MYAGYAEPKKERENSGETGCVQQKRLSQKPYLIYFTANKIPLFPTSGMPSRR